MKKPPIFPRYIRPRLLEALADTPAVLIHGPRQCGKTTLAQLIGEELGYRYFTFDDAAVLAAAREDPVGFVARLPERAVLDEVQRVPTLFASLKRAIDQERKAGRFILTGSANVLLAGTLKLSHTGRWGAALVERLLKGGYPEPQRRPTWRRRRDWYREYVETIVQRDIRELARISRLQAIPRLLKLAAGQSARLLNVSDLASPFQLSRPTIRDYLGLLEQIFLIDFLPPWHSNRIKRLVKTPKLHLGDTGLAGALLGLDVAQLNEDRGLLGQLLETFVYGELKRQASWHKTDLGFYHFRDKDGYEVDLVIQQDGRRFAGIEVKAASTVTERDFRGLRRFRDVVGKGFHAGVVLYDGEHVLPFGEGMHAVPLSALWSS